MQSLRSFAGLLLQLLLAVAVGLIASADPVVLFAAAAATDEGTVLLAVHNIRNHNQGKIHAGLFVRDTSTNRSDRLVLQDMSNAVVHKILDATASDMDIRFENVPYGEYAAFIFHDMSANSKLNSNFIGIPQEDLCISNNVKGGPRGGPLWDTASFVHRSKLTKAAPMKMNHILKI